MARHFIARQIFDISLNASSKSIGAQATIDQINQEKLLRLTEALFDKVDQKDRYIRFDKVELDLGIVTIDDFEEKFKQALNDSLISQLSIGQFPGQISVANEPNKIKIQSKSFQVLEALRYLLLSGLLPWWTDRREFDFDDMVSESIALVPEKIVQLLREIWSDEVNDRLYFQLSEKTFSGLFKVIINQTVSQPDIVHSFIDGLLVNIELSEQIQKKLQNNINKA